MAVLVLDSALAGVALGVDSAWVLEKAVNQSTVSRHHWRGHETENPSTPVNVNVLTCTFNLRI